jgi:translation initiation factor IF-1
MAKRNTTGGNSHKSFARKHLGGGGGGGFERVPNVAEMEKLAVVTKMLGDGKCYVGFGSSDDSGSQLLCHIRGKFRGRNKKNNLVGLGTFVIVALRPWESSIKNCDLVHVYDSHFVAPVEFIGITSKISSNGLVGGRGANVDFDSSVVIEDIVPGLVGGILDSPDDEVFDVDFI